jgi:hypothetical protein
MNSGIFFVEHVVEIFLQTQQCSVGEDLSHSLKHVHEQSFQSFGYSFHVYLAHISVSEFPSVRGPA